MADQSIYSKARLASDHEDDYPRVFSSEISSVEPVKSTARISLSLSAILVPFNTTPRCKSLLVNVISIIVYSCLIIFETNARVSCIGPNFLHK